jgi:hypothetical protein
MSTINAVTSLVDNSNNTGNNNNNKSLSTVVREIVGNLLHLNSGNAKAEGSSRNTRVICQICNCVTVKGHGLSADIAQRYPYADVYSQRKAVSPNRNLARKEDRSVPGTTQLCFPPAPPRPAPSASSLSLSSAHNHSAPSPRAVTTPTTTTTTTTTSDPIVACLYAQYMYGKPDVYRRRVLDENGKALVANDDLKQRLRWFAQSLHDLMEQLIRLHNFMEYGGIKAPTCKLYFPEKLGCGLGGFPANWSRYKAAIVHFAETLSTKASTATGTQFEVYIVHLTSETLPPENRTLSIALINNSLKRRSSVIDSQCTASIATPQEEEGEVHKRTKF